MTASFSFKKKERKRKSIVKVQWTVWDSRGDADRIRRPSQKSQSSNINIGNGRILIERACFAGDSDGVLKESSDHNQNRDNQSLSEGFARQSMNQSRETITQLIVNDTSDNG